MAKSKENSDWRDGFLFVGNHLVLDFLNTCPVQDGKPRELLPDFRGLLHWLSAAGLLSSRQIRNLQHLDASSRTARFTESVRELREELRQDVLASENGARVRSRTIEKLNHLLATQSMLIRLKSGASRAKTESWFEVRQPEDLTAPLVHSAAMLLANVPRDRIRKCRQCVLHFYDTSKKGTRRWCSMQLCGNRVKVAAYASRRRSRARRNDARVCG